jgi:hypothetical protein
MSKIGMWAFRVLAVLYPADLGIKFTGNLGCLTGNLVDLSCTFVTISGKKKSRAFVMISGTYCSFDSRLPLLHLRVAKLFGFVVQCVVNVSPE